MSGVIKINIDLGKRTITPAKLRWNRYTPTRGVRLTSEYLSNLSKNGPLKAEISPEIINAFGIPLTPSKYCAPCLAEAGVEALGLPKNTTAPQLKKIIKILYSLPLKEAQTQLDAEFEDEIKWNIAEKTK